ncbi:MAG: cardiolipin synthase [Ruminococcus sp.]|nr:cardiolipin synthase [Ruminococcus sp.]
MSGTKKKHINLMVIYRIAATALSLILQIAWFAVSIIKLSEYSVWITMFFMVLSFIMVMYIVCKDENPSYKMIWIILIMLLPIFGGLLYLLAGNKKPSKRMYSRLCATKESYVQLLDEYDTRGEEKIEQTDPRRSLTFGYIKERSGYPVFSDTQVKYYPMGELMYEDMLEAVRSAKHFIFLEYFLINTGQMWNGLLDILKEKANEGVLIRIIYDDMGCVALLPPGYFKYLESLSPNIKCLAFNPVVPFLSLVMNNRDHRKILVVDGYIGFNGGVNVSDEYINVTHPYGNWKDTGVRLKGEGVINLTEMFLELWHTFRDTDEKPDISKYAPSLYGGKYISDGCVQPFYDTPLDTEALSENLYIEIVNSAKDYVYIFTPYLILDDNMKSALCLAAKRGVDVRIVTPGIPDKKVIFRLTRANYAPLLKNGVRIYEYSPGFIHAKSFVSDDKIGVVGTINLDFRSLFLHFECGTLMYGCGALEDLKKDHLETMAKSREITLDNFKKYYKGTMFDAVLRLLAPLL